MSLAPIGTPTRICIGGAVATTGRAAGTADGHAPVGTLWATQPLIPTPFNRASAFTQKNVSATLEAMIVQGATGALYGAQSTTNSIHAAVISGGLAGSWTAQDFKTAGTSFGYFNPTVDNTGAVPLGGKVASVLYELQPTNTSGIAGTPLGGLVLTRSNLTFQLPAAILPPVASFNASPLTGAAPLAVTFTDTSTRTITNRFWNFGNGTTTNTTATSLTMNYAPGVYTVTLIVSGPLGSGTNAQINVIRSLTPYEAWQQQYFGCTACPEADPSADPLGKGLSNSNQFLLGLNPTSESSVFQIISTVAVGATNIVTWKTAGPRTNVLQAAAAGPSGNYSNVFQDISGPIIINVTGDTTTNYPDAGGATNRPARFYRIRLGP